MTPKSSGVTVRHRDFEITVCTFRKADKTWTAEATIRHEMERTSRPIPLLEGPSAEFRYESEAGHYGLHAAAEWLDEHYPAHDIVRHNVGEASAAPD